MTPDEIKRERQRAGIWYVEMHRRGIVALALIIALVWAVSILNNLG